MIYTDETLLEIWQKAKQDYKIQQKEVEFKRVMQLLNSKPKGLIVEIGCYDGGSTFVFSCFADRLISIDINNPARFKFDEIKKNCAYNYIGLDSNFAEPELLKLLEGKQIDVLMIDGLHTYEGARNDFFRYERFVKPGGLILLHDIIESEIHTRLSCFVSKFWQECKEQYKSGGNFSEILSGEDNWGGIGVINKF